jgi:hypothetical protein
MGLITGYKWIFGNGFTLQLGGGIAKSWGISLSYPGYRSDGRICLDYFDLLYDLKIGYSF